MSAFAPEPTYTPEDLLSLPGGGTVARLSEDDGLTAAGLIPDLRARWRTCLPSRHPPNRLRT